MEGGAEPWETPPPGDWGMSGRRRMALTGSGRTWHFLSGLSSYSLTWPLFIIPDSVPSLLKFPKADHKAIHVVSLVGMPPACSAPPQALPALLTSDLSPCTPSPLGELSDPFQLPCGRDIVLC